MAVLVGVISACWCFVAVYVITEHTNLDDACDIFAIHGMGGLIGTIFVGCLADPSECRCTGPPKKMPPFCASATDDHGKTFGGMFPDAPSWCANPGTVTRSWDQFWVQSACAVITAVYSLVLTCVVIKLFQLTCIPFLITDEEQESARDFQMHGENGYDLKDLLLIC